MYVYADSNAPPAAAMVPTASLPATPMPTAAVPKAFGEPGPLFYAVLTHAPASVVLRDSHGRTVIW